MQRTDRPAWLVVEVGDDKVVVVVRRNLTRHVHSATAEEAAFVASIAEDDRIDDGRPAAEVQVVERAEAAHASKPAGDVVEAMKARRDVKSVVVDDARRRGPRADARRKDDPVGRRSA